MINQTRRTICGGMAAASFSSLVPKKCFGKNLQDLPNIIFILADDLGYGDIGVYGHVNIKTPSIDKLSHQGLMLTQAYSNSPVCSATRVALMTGKYQYRLRAGLEEPIGPGEKLIGLPPECQTLPSSLKKHGYKTALIGKWHLGYLPKFSPLKSGYDEFFGNYGGAIDYFSHYGFSAQDDGLFHGTNCVREDGYYTDIIADHAIDFIKKRKLSEPFLLSVHFTAPHWPWEGPHDRGVSQQLKSLFHYDGGSAEIYGKMVQALDSSVGRILGSLDDKNLSDNTIVVFTSDNGGERFSNNGPFSGQKTELLEGGIRVPAIIRWPNKIPKATTTSQVSITMDWLPTLLGAVTNNEADLDLFDGINLINVFEGKKKIIERTLYWRYKANAQRAVRSNNLKYLKIRDNEFLFDIVSDKRERANLSAKYPDILDKMRTSWINWNAEMLPITDDVHTHWIKDTYQADHYAPDK